MRSQFLSQISGKVQAAAWLARRSLLPNVPRSRQRAGYEASSFLASRVPRECRARCRALNAKWSRAGPSRHRAAVCRVGGRHCEQPGEMQARVPPGRQWKKVVEARKLELQ